MTVWRQATENHIHYPPLQGNGWKQPQPGVLEIDWDSDESIAQVRVTVTLVKKGCGCKTGCLSAWCRQKKAGNHCGPGCKCLRYSNLPIPTSPDVHETDESEDLDSDSDGEIEKDVDEIMDVVFGGYDGEGDSETQSDFEAGISDNNMDVELDT